MTLVYASRVHETTSTIGTGTVNLGGVPGTPLGRRTFVAAVGSGNTCHYVIADASGNWEVGLGTVTSGSPDTLSRDTVFSSSAGGAKVNFGSGTKDVVLSPASEAFGGGWKPIQRQVISSAVAQVDFTTGIDGTYDHYAFAVSNLLPATAGADLYFLVSEDGGSNFEIGATDYEENVVRRTSSVADWVATQNSQGTTQITLTADQGNSAGQGASGTVEIYTPAATVNHHVSSRLHYMDASGTPLMRVDDCAGVYNGTTNAINALRFAYASGNIASGTIELYGLRNAA